MNPSWEAVQKLHDTILSSPSSSHSHDSNPTSHKRIRLTSSLIPVKYSSVLSLVPALHTTGIEGSKPDLIIHVGVGLDGSIRLEQRARKWGYEKLDVEGQLGPFDEDENKRGFAGGEWMEMREELRTDVDGKMVVEKAKRRGVEHVDISENAGTSDSTCQFAIGLRLSTGEETVTGLYLCEFTYFASLASALKQNSGRPTPVQFIHVPP